MGPTSLPVYSDERRRARDAIIAFARGEIDNHAFDQVMTGSMWKDRSIHEIAFTLWFTYDDFKSHPIHVNEAGWKLYRRCVAFLQTDLRMNLSATEAHQDEKIWPFATWRELYKHRRAARLVNYPRYDRTLHEFAIRTPAEEWGIRLRQIVVLLLLLFALWRIGLWVLSWAF
jgi:hypothetical protein